MERETQAKEYLDRERIDISLLITDEKITLKSSLITAKAIGHILMTVAMLLSLAFITEAPFVVVVTLGIILYVIWQDFESINNIVTYKAKKNL
jgi:hypothetical protein